MPGLLRGIGRTAVVAGTATAVGGRVRRRQERRWSEQEAPVQAPPAVPPSAAGGASTFDQLKQLGELKDQGVLTEQEFADQKAKLLAG
jgi:putative oligomerization/nucleic acid binding protein